MVHAFAATVSIRRPFSYNVIGASRGFGRSFGALLLAVGASGSGTLEQIVL